MMTGDLDVWLAEILRHEAAAAVPCVTILSGGLPGTTTPRCIADRPLPGEDRVCQWQLEPATEKPLWWFAAMREHDRAHLDEKGRRTVARIEADRRILALMEYAYDDPTYLYVVKILASVHADRPGYREEWRP